MPNQAFDQSTYQVRFDWGLSGLERLAPADIVVVVDVLNFSTHVIAEFESGREVVPDAATAAPGFDGAPIAALAGRSDGTVLLATHRNCGAVAREVMRVQTERGTRTSVAVIAAGERDGLDDALVERDGLEAAAGAFAHGQSGAVRFAVEDFLGAGAVIAALGDLGIDHCSPEAVAAAEAHRALRGATRHLLSASGTGRQLAAAGQGHALAAALAAGESAVVPRLRAGTFTH
ncbi:2-phosphosulfolactate phosphatase [Microbacterium sp. C7(2022)]|uniref:2-phosphosulfolactate phosphatase n=1 Tax=Microbacterium sp. C7(2022) TaxID=2992759 RepID=UPI00237AC8F9|nr:2-phosphosulfolactate phosphatase [Microbacterium sp. C7(2022)]MDE0545289.1 2-phosphosulfolactate phosphatase [Microbacterium sp. C7(2022)]